MVCRLDYSGSQPINCNNAWTLQLYVCVRGTVISTSTCSTHSYRPFVTSNKCTTLSLKAGAVVYYTQALQCMHIMHNTHAHIVNIHIHHE